MPKKSFFHLLSYLLFGLLSFIAFLYVTFPFSRLESALIDRIKDESGCEIDIRKKGILFPLKLAWENIQILCPGQKAWNVASLYAEVLPLPLIWGGEGRIHFRGRLAEGETEGTLTVTHASNQWAFSLKNQGRQITLPDIGGRLGWEGDAHWSHSEPYKGTGTVAFTLEGARIKEVGEWRSPIGALSFSMVTGQVHWQGGALSMEQFSADGNEMDLAGESGHLLLRQPWKRSILSLTLKVTPKGQLKPLAQMVVSGYTGEGALTLAVAGSLARPGLALNGKTIPL